MPLFLSLTPPDDARRRLEAQVPEGPRRTETVGLLDACGRVLAEDVVCETDLPGFARSAVDGYAVRACDTFGASDALPAMLALAGEVRMGSRPTSTLRPQECVRVMTGCMLPDGADAVVMVEHAEEMGERTVLVARPVAPGENVVGASEDVARGDVLLRRGRRLRAEDIAALAAAGVSEVRVAVGPTVAVMSTGDELVDLADRPEPGRVRDMNSYGLYAAAVAAGARPVRAGIVRDDPVELASAMRHWLTQSDMLVVSGGSSVGNRDLVRDAIASLGEPGVLVHGVAVRPGKPTILAVAGGKPVFGLPGHPVSCLVIFRLFVEPLIARWMGAGQETRREVRARLGANVASAAGREDYVPVSIRARDGETWADPVFTKSALISGLVMSDGVVRIPAEAEGLQRGAVVSVIIAGR